MKLKLSPEGIQNQVKWLAEHPEAMHAAQVAIYTMIGGGMLGNSAIMDPGSFYIDDRCGRLPYSRRDIMGAVRILAGAYALAGTPKTQPEIHLTNLGVF